MKDLEIEYYLGLLAILGIELYSSGNNSKIKNNILKGGVLRKIRGLPKKGETRLTKTDKDTIKTEYGFKANSKEEFEKKKDKQSQEKKEKLETKKNKERKKELKKTKEGRNQLQQEKNKKQAEKEKTQIEKNKGKKGTGSKIAGAASTIGKYAGSKMGVHSSADLSQEGKKELKKMKDKDAAKKAFDSRNWKSDLAKGAMKSVGKGIGKGAAAGASAGLKGLDNAGEFVKNLVNPSTFVVIGLIVGCIMFALFMGGPSILIISLLVASWYFLRNQINRYFPPVDSNPIMKSNNNNIQNNKNNNNNF